MSDPTKIVIQNCEYYLRIVTIFQVCIKQALLDVLHDATYNGLPKNNEHRTHALLLAFKKAEEKNLKRALNARQWDIICHECLNCAPNCPKANKTNTQDFDITIISVLLSNYLNGLPSPTNGWRKPLAPGDYSKGACGLHARDLRNRTTGHGSYHQISTQQNFDDIYSEIERILIGLGYNNMQRFIDLKTSSLDPFVSDQVKFLSCELSTIKTKYNILEDDLDLIKDKQETLEMTNERIMKLIEDLNAQQQYVQQSFNRRNIETSSVAVDTNLDNLNLVSEKLKKKYQKKYEKLRLSLEPKNTSFQPVQEIERNKIVVKLSLVPSAQVFEMNDEKQHINFLREKQKNAASSSFVYKDMFESNNDYVLISGVPGCGKTTLVETILHQWSIGEIWSNEEFQFVFIIYFRQLVKFRSDQNISCRKLLSHFYPGFDFSRIPQQKSLLILDGFDEFAFKEDFRKMHEDDFSPFVQAVYDLIDPNNTTLQFTRLLTSRPGSYPILFESVFNASFEQNLRIFEVIGFDDENIQNYVYNHLQNVELADSLLIKVKESALLQNFMIIPFYCWGFCYLINNESLTVDNFPVTTTAIYANILTLFIRKHGLRNPAVKLTVLFKSKKFQEIISILSKMAWMLYTQNKLIFNSNDLAELGDVNFLLESGLVIKVEADFEDYFQFIHYSFHEFLCALHVFYTLEKHVFSLNSNIRIMVAGLFGGKMPNSSSDAVVKLFSTMKASQFDFASIFSSLLTIDDFAEIVFELQNEKEKLSINTLGILPYSRFSRADPGKSAHLIRQCYNHNISINILHLYPFYTKTFKEDHDLLCAILTCCTTLECDVHLLYLLMMNFDFDRIKKIGKLDSLWLHCYILDWFGDFQKISAKLFDLIRHIKCVKILMQTKDIDSKLSWMKDFKSSVSEIEYSECSIRFYHSDELDWNRICPGENFFNVAALK